MRTNRKDSTMKTLFVNACVRPESRTHILADYVLNKLGNDYTELNLEKENIQPLNLQTMQERDRLMKSGELDAPMLQYAKQFAAAETVVIAAPYWDLSFPAMLKCYIEAICTQGITFTYSEEGFPVGLTNVKKVIYVTTAGGPTQNMDFGYEYVKGVFQNLFCIKDIVCFKGEMLDVIGFDIDEILANAKKEIDQAL